MNLCQHGLLRSQESYTALSHGREVIADHQEKTKLVLLQDIPATATATVCVFRPCGYKRTWVLCGWVAVVCIHSLGLLTDGVNSST